MNVRSDLPRVAPADRASTAPSGGPPAPPARRAWRRSAPVGWARRHAVLLAVLATLVVHVMSLTRRLGADEGGFAMVAQHWQ